MFPAYVSPCGWGTIEANGAKDTNKSAIALHLRRHKPLELIGLSSRLPSHGATGANWGIGFHGCELPKIQCNTSAISRFFKPRLIDANLR